MRESGFTEIRWYHGQIVRPKLIPVQRKLSFGYIDDNAADERSDQSKCQLFRFHCTGVTRQSFLGLEHYVLV